MDKIDHIAVAVTDISATASWYRANFELNTIYSTRLGLIEFENETCIEFTTSTSFCGGKDN